MNGSTPRTILFAGLLLVAPVAALGGDPTDQPSYEHPVIQEHGGIVPLPEAADQPQKGSMVLLDVVAVSAATVNINLQRDGYAVSAFK